MEKLSIVQDFLQNPRISGRQAQRGRLRSMYSPLCLTWRHLVATRSIGQGWQGWKGLVRADSCFSVDSAVPAAAALTFWTAAYNCCLAEGLGGRGDWVGNESGLD
ncbi:hypothetical protein RDI58_025272 [Solanum bulbocastanum]|uniref:Uncharacterized protein n=1 Tax=Solanum bulbocastanum TaxID=147425 RepID=A0AAN8Y438_SOLBU